MDQIVLQAMAKWPNVPHCYGWLALDARGSWRMRDQHAQHHGLPGDKILHTALCAFINRNYQGDANGNWYFQNGPQRVYVNLSRTPYILHTDTDLQIHDHTGQAWPTLDAAWMDQEGYLLLQSAGRIGQLDDRDLTQLLPQFMLAGNSADEAAWQAWLAGAASDLTFRYGGQDLPLRRLVQDAATNFGFCRTPQPDHPA